MELLHKLLDTLECIENTKELKPVDKDFMIQVLKLKNAVLKKELEHYKPEYEYSQTKIEELENALKHSNKVIRELDEENSILHQKVKDLEEKLI